MKNLVTKENILNIIHDLPGHFTIDELFDRIILLHKIDVGLEQDDTGQTNSTQEAKEKLEKWLM